MLKLTILRDKITNFLPDAAMFLPAEAKFSGLAPKEAKFGGQSPKEVKTNGLVYTLCSFFIDNNLQRRVRLHNIDSPSHDTAF